MSQSQPAGNNLIPTVSTSFGAQGSLHNPTTQGNLLFAEASEPEDPAEKRRKIAERLEADLQSIGQIRPQPLAINDPMCTQGTLSITTFTRRVPRVPPRATTPMPAACPAVQLAATRPSRTRSFSQMQTPISVDIGRTLQQQPQRPPHSQACPFSGQSTSQFFPQKRTVILSGGPGTSCPDGRSVLLQPPQLIPPQFGLGPFIFPQQVYSLPTQNQMPIQTQSITPQVNPQLPNSSNPSFFPMGPATTMNPNVDEQGYYRCDRVGLNRLTIDQSHLADHQFHSMPLSAPPFVPASINQCPQNTASYAHISR